MRRALRGEELIVGTAMVQFSPSTCLRQGVLLFNVLVGVEPLHSTLGILASRNYRGSSLYRMAQIKHIRYQEPDGLALQL